jgi:hypothetical protein
MKISHHKSSPRRAKKSAARHPASRRKMVRGAAEHLERREMLSATPDEVAAILAHSAEHYAYQIDNIYQQYLGRGADSSGEQFWVASMQHGMTQEQLEADFIGSSEYIADHGGKGSGWVTGMYNDLLGRTPDNAGLTHWVDSLASGVDAATVALGFAASGEREAMKVTSDYQNLLGRTPGASEIASWVNAFEHGVTNDDVVAGFVSSAEFLERLGEDLVHFIDAAYHELLGRSADPAAIQHWYDTLHPPTTTDTTAAHLTIAAPSTAAAGTPFTVTVSATDSAGNVATGYTGTVHLLSNDTQADLPDSYTFTAADAGLHTFSVTLKTAGTKSVSAYDCDDHLEGTGSVVVSPVAVSRLQIYEKAATVGVSHNVYVIARDAYGNIATSYDGTVHFSSSDSQAVLPADSTLTNGLGYFPVTMNTGGQQTITVTDTVDSSLTTTASVTFVRPPAPTPPPSVTLSYVISGPTSAAAGSAQDYTASVRDQNGNLVTDYTGKLKFYSTDTQAVLPPDYTFTTADAGVHTFAVTLNTVGVHTIYFIDASSTAIHGYINVNVT